MSHLQTQTIQRIDEVDVRNLELFRVNSEDLTGKAMELTDSWGQAMFILDSQLVERIFSVLGFSKAVSKEVYNSLLSLEYVRTKNEKPVVTWHILDAACLTLRGFTGLGSALSEIGDENIDDFLESNIDLFEGLMGAMPEYTQNLMFSPDVASLVVATLGGKISASKIYDLASTYGRQRTRDLEGRLGVSTQFIRSLTLTICAKLDF